MKYITLVASFSFLLCGLACIYVDIKDHKEPLMGTIYLVGATIELGISSIFNKLDNE
jgi:hypothetical protein